MLLAACRRVARTKQTRCLWNGNGAKRQQPADGSVMPYVKLSGVPKTACDADIKRMLEAAGVVEVKSGKGFHAYMIHEKRSTPSYSAESLPSV